MSDFSIDDVLSQFGSAAPSKKKKDFDVDSILKEFHGTTEEPKSAASPVMTKEGRIYVAPIAPPISGVSKEASDELNRRPNNPGGENPRSWIPNVDIPTRAYEADKAGKELFSSGVEDLQSGHPYSGLGKAALGAFSRVASPMTGIIQGGVVDPVTDITGSPDIGDRAGFIAGSTLPVVPGAGAVVKAIPKNKALATLVENIGPENLPAVVSAMKANPRLNPADLSPRVLQDTQHLFTQEGPQIDYLAKISAARMAGRKDAIAEAYDASGGVPPDLAQKITDLANASKTVGQQKINPAVAGAGPVNIKPVIEHIDAILKPGVMSKISEGSTLALPEVKQALASAKQLLTNGKETRTGASDLHDIQSSLRRQSYNLLKSPNPGDREIGHALLGVRNKIVEAIDTASPKAGVRKLPEVNYNGPSGVKTTPLENTKLYHETSSENAVNILKEDLTNNVSNIRSSNMFLTDSKDLALGQKGKGITLEFDGNLVSGKEHLKPGSAISSGKEYKADALGNGSVSAINIAPGEKLNLSPSWQAKLEANFNKIENSDGSVRYELKKANGSGTYKPALESYRDEMHIADAFKKGHDDIFTSSKKIENDPSFVKKWYDGLTDSEKQAATEGARAAIYTEMGVAKNAALAGESVARSDFNKAKMEILFGKEEAKKLLDKLDAERAIANTHQKVVEGSQTAMRSASKSQFSLPTKSDAVKAMLPVSIAEGANAMIGGYPILPTLALGAAKGGAMAKDAVKLALARNHNAQYAKYALPTEGPTRDELIRSLEAQIPGPKKSLLTRASAVASKIVP